MSEKPTTGDRPRTWALWLAGLGAIGLWQAHIVLMPAVASYRCEDGPTWALHVLTVVLLVPTAGATWFAWRSRTGGRSESSDFLARVMAATALVSTVAIVAEWVPVFMIPRCG